MSMSESMKTTLVAALISMVATGITAWVVVREDLADVRATQRQHAEEITKLNASVSSLVATAGELNVAVGKLDTTVNLTRESLLKALEKMGQ